MNALALSDKLMFKIKQNIKMIKQENDTFPKKRLNYISNILNLQARQNSNVCAALLQQCKLLLVLCKTK